MYLNQGPKQTISIPHISVPLTFIFPISSSQLIGIIFQVRKLYKMYREQFFKSLHSEISLTQTHPES